MSNLSGHISSKGQGAGSTGGKGHSSGGVGTQVYVTMVDFFFAQAVLEHEQYACKFGARR